MTGRDRTGARRRWAPAAVAVTAVVIATIACGGCSRGESGTDVAAPAQPEAASTETSEVLDLIDAFANLKAPADPAPQTGDSSRKAPYVNPERGVLFVPLGAEVWYDVELPPGGELVTGDTRNFGSATGNLEVIWAPDNGAERILTGDLSASPTRGACFGNAGFESGRLMLRARSSSDDELPQAGIRVFHPKVVAGSPCEPRLANDPARRPGLRPNIVVYLIDALRADRVGCYGYDRGTTPRIDEFASTALVFTDAQAQTSWTRPAVASIFTGLLPQQHRAIDKGDVLPDQATTLAELLSAAGYQTAAVISNGNVARAFGFAQGFDYFKRLEQVTVGREVVRSGDLNPAVFSWLDRERDSTPFFLYVHTVDPHLPYDPPLRSGNASPPGSKTRRSVQWQWSTIWPPTRDG